MIKLKRSVFQVQGPALDQQQLNVVLDAHKKFLGGGGGARATLRSADLHGLDLSQRMLSEADFSGADLVESSLWGSVMDRASFASADLRGANLTGANLKFANLRGARLSGATLNHASLDGADLKGANLVPTVDSEGRQTHPPSADCGDCSMRGARFTDANLAGVNFAGAILEGADFVGAQLTGANFDGAVLTSVPVEMLAFTKDQLRTCVLSPSPEALDRAARLVAVLEEARAWVSSAGRRGAPGVLDGEDLRTISQTLPGRNLAGLSARGACGVGVDFSGCRLEGANFEGADLRGARFEGANLRGASFKNARLAHARFKGANLEPLILPDSRRHPPNFTGAQLARADFTDVLGGSPVDG